MENNWKFHHVGVVVRDMDKVVEYYQSLGIGTFQPEVLFKSSDFADFRVNGKTPNTIVKVRVRSIQIGPLRLELIQPVEGEAPWKEFLDSNGEGINHIGFGVDDLDKETAKLVEKGASVIHSGVENSRGAYFRWAYFDTRKVGNVIIELSQRRK